MIAICLALEAKAQDYSVEGVWVTMDGSDKVFDFTSKDSLKISYKKENGRVNIFPILIEGGNILILDNGIAFDTLKIVNLEERAMFLYYSFIETTIRLVKSGEPIINEEKLEALKTKNYRFKIKDENADSLNYFVLRENHILKEIFRYENDCVLKSKVQFENTNIGLVIDLELRIKHYVEDYKVVVTEIRNSSISGYLKKNGLKVELSFEREEEEVIKEIHGLNEFIGTYFYCEDSTELFKERLEDVPAINLGYTRYQFNKDKSFVYNDKWHKVDVYGTWRLFEYEKEYFLGLEGSYEEEGIDYEYKSYRQIVALKGNYLLLAQPNCEGGHGHNPHLSFHKQYFKKVN